MKINSRENNNVAGSRYGDSGGNRSSMTKTDSVSVSESVHHSRVASFQELMAVTKSIVIEPMASRLSADQSTSEVVVGPADFAAPNLSNYIKS